MIRVVHPGSRIQVSKRHPIPDPDPQHWFIGCLNISLIVTFSDYLPAKTGLRSVVFGVESILKSVLLKICRCVV
jgi:hypothetical protein